MSALNRWSRMLLVVLLIAAGVSSKTQAEESLIFAEDGWYSWRVASVEEFEEEHFYVLVKKGEARKIHVIGNHCSGVIVNGWSIRQTARKLPDSVELGLVDTDRSIDWFSQYIGKRGDLSSDALAAISQHQGSRAVQIMIDVVESDAPMDVREEAVFWMAQSGSEEAFAYIDSLLMLD